MKKIRISKDLALPAENFVESASAVLGTRGGGKSGLIKVMTEELSKVKLPFVVFDPVGIAWGLRSSLDGTKPGYPVLVVGGPHRDIRLERRGGEMVARAIVEANISAIIDFSEESKGVYREFVRDFSHTLFAINNSPRVVIIEEAPELVPQMLRASSPGMAETFEAVERLVSRGRNKGIGVVLVSQRAATINKDVLTQIDALFIFGLTSPQDRKAVQQWVEGWGAVDKFAKFEEGLASLHRQECWVWAPRPDVFGGIFRKIRIRNFTTFHPDKTHLRRMGLLKVNPVTEDVSGIVAKLGAQMEHLSKKGEEKLSVSRLQRELAKSNSDITRMRDELQKARSREHPQSNLYRDGAKAIEKYKLEISTLKRLVQFRDEKIRRVAQIARRAIASRSVIDSYVEKFDEIEKSLAEELIFEKVAEIAPITVSVREKYETFVAPILTVPELPREVDESQKIRKGARLILAALASRHPDALSRVQVSTLAGLSPRSGSFSNYLSVLRSAGYISENGANLMITMDGFQFLNTSGQRIEQVPTEHRALIEMWKRKLRAGAARMLQVLVDAYPASMSRQELGERSQMGAQTGTFSNYLSALRGNGLLVDEGRDVKASSSLFPGL